jgi:hypothetical protein
LCVFIKHQIMSHVLNFVVEILLVLSYDPADWSNYERLPFLRDVGVYPKTGSTWLLNRCPVILQVVRASVLGKDSYWV